MDDFTELLGSEDLFNLRLSSRFLRNQSHGTFVRRYFNRRVHLLTQRSLDCLLEIGSNDTFRREIRTIVFDRRTITDSLSDVLSDVLHFNTRYAAISHHFAESQFLYETGTITDYLRRILVNMTECRSISIDDFSGHSWGRASLERATGYRAVCFWADLAEPRRNLYDFIAFRSVMDAMSLSSARITAFNVSPTFPSRALLFHGEDESEQRIDNSTWATALTALDFRMFMASPTFHVEHITLFANRFANLKYLSLASIPWGLGMHGGGYEYGIQTQLRNLDSLSRSLRLPQLRSLTLERFVCMPESLLELLYAHRDTLTELSLYIVGISTQTGGSWSSLLVMVRDRLDITRLRLRYCSVAHPINHAPDYYDSNSVYYESESGRSHIVEVEINGPGSLNRLISGLKELGSLREYPDHRLMAIR